ncbi:signal transducing adapter molecule 1-like [Corticium candelabrum]|uniref:signal transducing adapter molecule 1-like n=1 Tax=Corticium candelabrum TaxID=121492 RepID=UPI002E25D5BA|nr:signal transducing adapter molecule 1-like [Corticium candelabrum]
MSRSIYDDVAKATSDEKSDVDWALVMDICDRVNESQNGPAEVMKAVKKRLGDPRALVVLHTLNLLGALVENCGKQLHLLVCSRDFATEFRRLVKMSGPQQKVADKMKELIHKWVFENFKGHADLGIIEYELYWNLKREGVHFPSSGAHTMPSASSTVSKPAGSVQISEDEQLARAIQMSLNESTSSSTPQAAPVASSVSSLYPQLGGNRAPSPTPTRRAPAEMRKVRALFNFEAAEDNELSFKAGDIIGILDDSDPNWWRGQTYEGIGLFPANFVSPDLSAPPPSQQLADRRTRFADSVPVTEKAKKKAEISEEKIDLLLEMLKNADATDANGEEDATVKELEAQCKEMGGLVTDKMRETDRAVSELTKLKEQFEDAMAMYQRLIKEVPKPAVTLAAALPVAEPEPPAYSQTGSQAYGYQGGMSSQYAPQPAMATGRVSPYGGQFYTQPPPAMLHQPPMGAPVMQHQTDGHMTSGYHGMPTGASNYGYPSMASSHHQPVYQSHYSSQPVSYTHNAVGHTPSVL